MDDLIAEANAGKVTLYGWRNKTLSETLSFYCRGVQSRCNLGDPLPLDAPPPIPTPIPKAARMLDIDGEAVLLLGGPDQNGDYHYYRGVVVQRHWAEDEPRRSGAPGRPSSMALVLERFKHTRADLEKTCHSRLEAGRILSAWLREAHPSEPQLTQASIRNNLPTDFRPNAKKLTK
jgi:hypothetical protein